MMKIEEATTEDIMFVARHMRESDFQEFSALYDANDREMLASILDYRYRGRPDIIVAKNGPKPVAIGAPLQCRPNVITLMFFATDELPEIGSALTRFIVQRLFPPMKKAGVHRIECASIEGHTVAHNWIRALGLQPEGGLMRGYGKNGEAFQQFAWVADHVR